MTTFWNDVASLYVSMTHANIPYPVFLSVLVERVNKMIWMPLDTNETSFKTEI